MTKLTALAPAKVNLCLLLGGTRADGRHELVTVFESISLADRLELSVLAEGPDHVVCPGVDGTNLVSAALAGLRAAGWGGPPLLIEIGKQTPVAAGLGGGSADAAAALRLAGELEPIAGLRMAELAASLGADVAGQLVPGVSLGTGAGEVVERLPWPASHAFLILPAAASLSTAEVYREADRMALPRSAEELAGLERDVRAAMSPGARLPAALLANDLAPAAISLHPPIEQALDDARYAGAEHAMVCGSGPTVAGLYWGEGAPARAAAGVAALKGRYPGACAVVPVDESAGIPHFA
jgi:4-diphosphocytidyl-2-C-methyl-D-erythritol kinase